MIPLLNSVTGSLYLDIFFVLCFFSYFIHVSYQYLLCAPNYKTKRYLAYYLWEEAEKCSSLVAVVERTHLKGVPKYWRTAFMVSTVVSVLFFLLE